MAPRSGEELSHPNRVAQVLDAEFSVHVPRHANDCKKFDVQVSYVDQAGRFRKNTIAFGARSAKDPKNDYPHHKDSERKRRYIGRHTGKGEGWELEGVAGANTAGFYAMEVLWSSKTPGAIQAHLRRKLRLPHLQLPRAVVAQLRRPYELCGT